MSSVVGDTAVRGRGVGAREAELEQLQQISEWRRSNKSEKRVILSGVMFLTRIPCPGWCDHHPGYLVLALAWFPVLGAVIGLWAGLVYDAMWMFVKEPALCALISVVATEFLTMCFHDDGLADAADAFAGGWSRPEVFAILKDSRIGTFGTIALILFLYGKLQLITLLGHNPSHWSFGRSSGAAPIMIVASSLSRATAAPLMYHYEYVLGEDDAKGEFYEWVGKSSRELLSWQRVLFSTLSALGIVTVISGWQAAFMGGVVVGVLGVLAGRYAQGVLGGVQGDFLGATICVAEVVVYAGFVAWEGGKFEFLRELREIDGVLEGVLVIRPLLALGGVAWGLFRGVRKLL